MLSEFWDQIASKFVLYFVLFPFFGIIAFGSVSYFARISHASEMVVREFLEELHFPFTIFIKVYYGDIEDSTLIFIRNMESGTAIGWRIIGSIFPILSVFAFSYNMVAYQHTSTEIYSTLILICMMIGMLLMMWRFGTRLIRLSRRDGIATKKDEGNSENH